MIEFDYVDFKLPDGTIISRPFVDCFILNPKSKRGILLAGIIDSGADNITLSRDFAERFGFDLDQNSIRILGIGGYADVVREYVKITFLDGEQRHVIDHVPVNFIMDSRYQNFVVFGRIGIFTEFDIEFKERERKVLFRR